MLLVSSAEHRQPQQVSVAEHFDLLVHAVSSDEADIAAAGVVRRPAKEVFVCVPDIWVAGSGSGLSRPSRARQLEMRDSTLK